MQTAVRITFRHMDVSPALESHIREHIAKVESLCDRIVACNVVVDVAAHRRATGVPFNVKIELTMPEHHLIVHSGHANEPAHTDAYVAVRTAFDTLRRLLQDHLSSQRDARKVTEASLTGA